jgi:hypothetical protein
MTGKTLLLPGLDIKQYIWIKKAEKDSEALFCCIFGSLRYSQFVVNLDFFGGSDVTVAKNTNSMSQ